MNEKTRDKLRRIQKDVEHLTAYDGVSTPPDWRPFVVELIDALLKDASEPSLRR